MPRKHKLTIKGAPTSKHMGKKHKGGKKGHKKHYKR